MGGQATELFNIHNGLSLLDFKFIIYLSQDLILIVFKLYFVFLYLINTVGATRMGTVSAMDTVGIPLQMLPSLIEKKHLSNGIPSRIPSHSCSRSCYKSEIQLEQIRKLILKTWMIKYVTCNFIL